MTFPVIPIRYTNYPYRTQYWDPYRLQSVQRGLRIHPIRIRLFTRRSATADCTARRVWLFRRRVNLFALKFYLYRVAPHQPIFHWHQKTRHWATWWWRLHASAFPRVDTIPECDGQTDGRSDGRICRSVYRDCTASFAARCKNHISATYWRE